MSLLYLFFHRNSCKKILDIICFCRFADFCSLRQIRWVPLNVLFLCDDDFVEGRWVLSRILFLTGSYSVARSRAPFCYEMWSRRLSAFVASAVWLVCCAVLCPPLDSSLVAGVHWFRTSFLLLLRGLLVAFPWFVCTKFIRFASSIPSLHLTVNGSLLTHSYTFITNKSGAYIRVLSNSNRFR